MVLQCDRKQSLSSKVMELGHQCDNEVLSWKEEYISIKEKERCLCLLQDNLEQLNYLPHLPSLKEVEDHLEKGRNMLVKDYRTQGNYTEFETLNTEGRNLCYDKPEPVTLLQSICSELHDKGIGENVLNQCFQGLLVESNGSHNLLDAVIEERGRVKPGLSYQIVGDNVDLEVKVRHMSNKNKNKSLHYFNLVAFKDQVSGNHLPDMHDRMLADVPIYTFLPSRNDLQMLKRDFIVM